MKEENWDDMNQPEYIPDIENKKIIRKTPANLSKKQKKEFYARETERWARIKQEEKIKINRENQK